MDRDAQILAVLERVANLLDRLVEPEAPAKPAKKSKRKAAVVSMKDRVSVIRTNHYDPPTEAWDGRGLPPSGGTPREDFWARADEHAAEMRRPARKMGRRFE